MIGLFIANPGPKANPRHGTAKIKRGRRIGMARATMRRRKARRNAWPGSSAAHGSAAHIGWAYRSDRKKGPAPVMRYLAAAGLSPSALRKFRGSRKTKPAILLGKRVKRKRRSGRPREAFKARPFLVNRGRSRSRSRRVGRYASFVRSFARRSRLSGPALMKAAGRAWRGGARRNQGVPGAVYFNRPRRSKGRRRGKSRRNPVLPYFAFENRGRKSRRSRSRRNPILPYAAFNSGRRKYRYNRSGSVKSGNAMGTIKGAFETAISVDYWTGTVLPMGGGFIGAQFVGGLLYGLGEKVLGDSIKGSGFVASAARVGFRALGAVATSAVVAIATRKGDIAGKVLAGGLVAVFASLLQELFGSETYNKITGMADFGDMAADLTDELKARIAESVRGEIAAAEGGAGVSAFVSTQNLQTAPQLGPGPRVGEMGSFVNTQDLQTAPQYQEYPSAGAPSEPPVVADLATFSDSFADMMLV